MLQRNNKPLKTYSFFVTVEAEEDIDLDKLENKLAENVMWMEGTGKITVVRRNQEGQWTSNN